MIHPLLHLIATEPHLLGEHAEAYLELVGAEVDRTTKSWKSRVVLYALAVALLTTGVLFTGIALMLWALMPSANMNAPWLLVVVPLAPLLASAVCAVMSKARPTYPAFDVLKRQVSADLAMLREVTAP